jgi:hypothetical protein
MGEFSRSLYDPEISKQKVSQSTRPLDYRLESYYAEHPATCFPQNSNARGECIPGRINPTEPMGTTNVDLESHLKGLRKGSWTESRIISNLPNCPQNITTEYTRMSEPAYELHGRENLRLDYPLYDPQFHVFENFAINTRLHTRDNHRAVWQEILDDDLKNS